MSAVKSLNNSRYISVQCQHLKALETYEKSEQRLIVNFHNKKLSELVITRESIAFRATYRNHGFYLKPQTISVMKFSNFDEANRVFMALAYQDEENQDNGEYCENIDHNPMRLDITDLSSEMERAYYFVGCSDRYKINFTAFQSQKLVVTNNGSHIILTRKDDQASITIIDPSFTTIEWESYPNQPTLVK